MPQFGSEDDDEAWLTELIGFEAVSPINIAAEAYTQAEECWKTINPPLQTLKIHSVAEPGLPQTPDLALSANPNECDLPGPLSRDDDEDSSPRTQDMDLAKHIPCSTPGMTSFGREHNSLTYSGFLMGPPVVVSDFKTFGTTGSNRKVTPRHPQQNKYNIEKWASYFMLV